MSRDAPATAPTLESIPAPPVATRTALAIRIVGIPGLTHIALRRCGSVTYVSFKESAAMPSISDLRSSLCLKVNRLCRELTSSHFCMATRVKLGQGFETVHEFPR